MSEISLSESKSRQVFRNYVSQNSFARERASSQVTGKILRAKQEEFHQVSDIKEALDQVSTVFDQYKTKYIVIEDEIVMALTFKINEKFIVIGKKYGGKLIYYVIDDELFNKKKEHPGVSGQNRNVNNTGEVVNKHVKNEEQKKVSEDISRKIKENISEILGIIVKNKDQDEEFMKKIRIQKCYIERNKFVVAYEGIFVAEFEVVVGGADQKVQIKMESGKASGCSLKEYFLGELVKKLEEMRVGNVKEVGRIVEKDCSDKHFFEIYCAKEIKFAVMSRKCKSLVQFWKNGDLYCSCKVYAPKLDARKGGKSVACPSFINMFKYSADGNYLVVKFNFNIEKSYEYISIEESYKQHPSTSKHYISLESSYKIQESITDLTYSEFNKTLIVSTKSGKVILFDHQIKGRKLYIDCHKQHLVKLFLNADNIYTVGLDKRIGQTKLYSMNSQLQIHLDDSQAKKNQFLSMNTSEPSGSLSILSQFPGENSFTYTQIPSNTTFKFTLHSDSPIKLSKFILSYNKALICNDQHSFYYIKTGDSHQVEVTPSEKSQDLVYNQIVVVTDNATDYIVCAGFSNVLDVYEIKEPDIRIFQERQCEHFDNITALASCRNVFISGSVDGTLKLWKIEGEIKFVQEISHPLTHSLQVTNIVILKESRNFVTTSYDRSIKIWKLNGLISASQPGAVELSVSDQQDKKVSLSYSITQIPSIIKYVVPVSQEKYLMTCSNFGDIGLWSLQTFTQVLSIRLCAHIDYFFVNEKIIYYCEEFRVFSLKNNILNNKHIVSRSERNRDDRSDDVIDLQIQNGDISIMGPDLSQLYRVMRYFRQCLKNKSPEFNAEYDKWVVFPYLLSSQHIYAFHNMPDHLALSLENKTCLNESIQKQSPLSISVSKDFENCVISIVKYVKLHIDANPFLINFISDTSLIEMNFTGHDSLLLFYSILFRNVEKTSNLKFASFEADLPAYIKSPEAVLNYKETFDNIFTDEQESGQPIVFMRSLVSITLIMGSKRSLDLLQSIIECKNLKIYSTEFIQAYIEHKLPMVLYFMYFQGILYLAYLCFLVTFLLMSEINYAIVAFIFIFVFILTLIEVVKALAYGRRYFLNPWNYIDAVRTLVFAFLFVSLVLNYIILPQFEILNYIRYLFLAASITSFIRGLAYFRLFEGTRYFTNLLFQVFYDSKAFMIFSIYNICCFAFLFYISNQFSDNIINHLANTFLIVYGSYSPEDNNLLIWIVYIAAVGLNNWMMLNIMIAVYSDTFEKVTETQELYNYSTLAEMAFETECFMLWRRNFAMVEDENSETGFCVRERSLGGDKRKVVKEFIHVCRAVESGEDVDPMLRRVKELKSRAKQLNLGASKALDAVSKITVENEKILKGLINKSNSQDDIFRKKIIGKVLTSVLNKINPNFGNKVISQFFYWKIVTFHKSSSNAKNQERKCALELFKILVKNSVNKNLEKRNQAKKEITRNIKQLILV